MYTRHVASFNKTQIYANFKAVKSPIRIMVCTTALGMGMDISGIERVYQWGFPITMDLGDLVQRFGRGARGSGQTATAVFFVPYYMFNCLSGDAGTSGQPVLLSDKGPDASSRPVSSSILPQARPNHWKYRFEMRPLALRNSLLTTTSSEAKETSKKGYFSVVR
ncbi:hypothetical protein BU23DRAFT_568906 [Bimuria novae-zelandiae CBS 107.79]|uniref:Helicase C-terminal domain-containing protein n=1 Tax=Bimuria novae-zelandiae CBS 107.79 TaxID=1447943 RepID=A0A6A5V6L6_9PLEO|nr:hypothetical protein BU23DRAFT_568906 [Bimuria novae-zelandiae CBS 107.79]